MDNASLVGLSRQLTLRRQMDVVANNIANLNTNAFKAQTLLFTEQPMPRAATIAFPPPDRPASFVLDDRNIYDFEPGSMIETKSPLDVAVQGDGWFVVETPRGERFTRNGAFAIDSQGRLVTRDGHPVLTDAGPLQLNPNDTDITIAEDGTISTPTGVKGKLRLVRFENQDRLAKVGDTLFQGDAPLPAEGIRVAQGRIEASNVRGVVELTRMVEVQRAYQQVSSLMKDLDELRRTAVDRLGQVN